MSEKAVEPVAQVRGTTTTTADDDLIDRTSEQQHSGGGLDVISYGPCEILDH